MVSKMNVFINGEPHCFARSISISAMLKELRLMPEKVAIERNLQIVPRSLFSQTELQDGDRIEIVRFIGGG